MWLISDWINSSLAIVLAVLLNSFMASSEREWKFVFLSAAARLSVSDASVSASCGNLVVLYESRRWSSFCFSSQSKLIEGPET